MNELVVYFIGFLSGGVSFLVLTLFYAAHAIRRRETALKEFMNSAEDLLKGGDTVSERMSRVREITARQIDMQGQTEQPQKSGLDGKYKNVLNGEIKVLEEEKIAILNSILADGHDPILTISAIDGAVEDMKLSEFMAQQGLTAPLPQPEGAKRVGKFLVYSNKPDDGKSNA